MVDVKTYELGWYGKTVGKDRKDTKDNLARHRSRSISVAPIMEVIDALTSGQELYLIPVVSNGKYGFVNQKAELVCECKYDDISGAFYTKDNFVAVKKGNKWTAIDSSFNELLDAKYDLIHTSPDCSLAVVKINYKNTQVLDLKTEDMVAEAENSRDTIDGYRYGYSKAQRNGLWGIMNTEGEFVFEPKFTCMLGWYDRWFRPETKVKVDNDEDWSPVIDLHTFDK